MITEEKFEDNIEEIESEADDNYSDDSLFNISSWGADLSCRELVSMYDDGELEKPEIQRKYVWTRAMASKFVESLLLGLPVPSIFLAKSGSRKLIVDGYQRIMTIHDYMRGSFSDDGKPFRLSNSDNINRRWKNKAFSELTEDEKRNFRSTTIHAIMFEQKKPENDDTSMYQIFERINTSGKNLTAQEIRNCVYQGRFNSMLFELNEDGVWRRMFGDAETDQRMRDMEFILRFFAIKDEKVLNSSGGQISLKKSLNEYMGEHKNDGKERIAVMKEDFLTTVHSVYTNIGENAFRNWTDGRFSKKFHPAIYDAVMIATYFANKKGLGNREVSEEKRIRLLSDGNFISAIEKNSRDPDGIRARINMVGEAFYGISFAEP